MVARLHGLPCSCKTLPVVREDRRDCIHLLPAVFDFDGNGLISTEELKSQMMSLGENPYTEKEFEDFMAEYIAVAMHPASLHQHPADTDKLMDYHEFIRLMLRK